MQRKSLWDRRLLRATLNAEFFSAKEIFDLEQSALTRFLGNDHWKRLSQHNRGDFFRGVLDLYKKQLDRHHLSEQLHLQEPFQLGIQHRGRLLARLPVLLRAEHARFLVRRSLELIRDQSTLNVRILTRSPLVRADFDLFRSFGKRLVFGMSLPTLRNDLAKVYEPKAPAPSQRLAALRAAKESGLHVYVAMAPTYPECDEADLRSTLQAAAELEPLTIFQEPINIRAENVTRIETQAASLGIRLRTEVFATRESWQDYAVNALQTVERLAEEVGIADQLHLWPDKSLGTESAVARVVAARNGQSQQYRQWLQKWWRQVSEWPQ